MLFGSMSGCHSVELFASIDILVVFGIDGDDEPMVDISLHSVFIDE